jgi:hypothetical protein
MARIGKRELASLGIDSDADEPPSKSTCRITYGQTSATTNSPRSAIQPVQQLDEQPPSKQLDAQPPATKAEAEAVPGEQLESASTQVAPEEGDVNWLCRVEA